MTKPERFPQLGVPPVPASTATLPPAPVVRPLRQSTDVVPADAGTPGSPCAPNTPAATPPLSRAPSSSPGR